MKSCGHPWLFILPENNLGKEKRYARIRGKKIDDKILKNCDKKVDTQNF